MTTPLACLIVDDEPLAREILEGFVECCNELSLAGSYSSAAEARDFLKNSKVDLLLLDINMPNLSGVDLVKSLGNPPPVIFTTAYPQYAVDGFEVDAIDYLLKPILFERFKKAVAKAVERSASSIPKINDSFIMLKSSKKIYKTSIASILFLESVGDYVRVHTVDRKIVIHETIKSLSALLPPHRFMRIHKSYTIAIDRIEYLEGNLVKVGDELLPVSQTFKEQLLERLK